MEKLICPACGSSDVKVNIKSQRIEEAFGVFKDIQITENVCQLCETSGDFLDLNSNLISETVSELRSRVVTSILENFQAEGFSLASMERALNIPQRTFAKWKNRAVEPSATGVTLLKFIKLFPWLLKVGDSNFEPIEANKLMLTASIEKFSDFMKIKDYKQNSANIDFNPELESVNFNFEFNKLKEEPSSEPVTFMENTLDYNNNSSVHA